MEEVLTFAKKDGRVVHVDDVARGDKCGCQCPCCGAELRANKGKRKKHYFSHQPGKECSHALETALHLAAKEVLMTATEIHLPDLTMEAWVRDANNKKVSKQKKIVKSQTAFSIGKALEEQVFQDVKPDVILDIEGSMLFVEVAVTHFIDEVKRKKLKQMNVSTIEINLSKLPRGIGWEELKGYVLSGCNSEWIYSRKFEEKKEEMQIVLNKEVEKINKGIKREKELQKQEKAKQKQEKVKQERKDKAEKEQLKLKVESADEAYTKFINDIVIIRKRYEDEATSHPVWGKVSAALNISEPDELPKYLSWIACASCEDDCTCMFNCDYRLWQSLIFTELVFNNKLRFNDKQNKQKFIKECLSLLKSNGIKAQRFYSDISYAAHKGVIKSKLPREWDVVSGFVEHLIKLGMIEAESSIWLSKIKCSISSPVILFDKYGCFFCEGCNCYRHHSESNLVKRNSVKVFACKVCGNNLSDIKL